MEQKNEVTAAVAELVNLKAKIERESAEIIEEREKLIEKLKQIRQEKESQLAQNAEIYQKIEQERPELLALRRQIDLLADHIILMREAFESGAKHVLDQLTMSSFATSIYDLKSSIESALNFYSDDSLQMELMKRNSANRDLRVELTRITGEVDQRRREIEAEMEEKRRIKQAEMERQKQEEERRKLIAEEAARKIVRQSPVPSPDLSVSNFRSVSFAGRSPEPAIPFKQSFTRESTLSPTEGARSSEGNSRGKLNTSILPSFSQITRGW